MRSSTSGRRGGSPTGPSARRSRHLARVAGAALLRLLAVVVAAVGAPAGPLDAATAPVIDLRAAALLMSGQEGGDLRPEAAVVSAGDRRSAVVSIRLPREAAQDGPGTSTTEVFLYSLGPGGEVVDRAGWSLGQDERARLLAAEVETLPGGEIRLLARTGERLGLVRRALPAAEAGAFWWPIEEGEEALRAPDRDVVADPSIADPRPRLSPGEEREAVACGGAPGSEAALSVELTAKTGEVLPLEVRPAGVSASGDCRPVAVAIPRDLRTPEAVVARRDGQVLDRRRPMWPADAGSAPAAPDAGSEEDAIDPGALRSEWRGELVAALSGAGSFDRLVGLEGRILEVAGPETLRTLPDPWLAELSPDALLGLATVRLELARLHGSRPGGYAGAVLGIESAGELADLVAAGGRPEAAAALGDLVALHWLERGARRPVREQLGKAVEREDSAPRRIALGVLEEKRGRRAEAIEHFERALRLEPGHPEARLRLGVQLARTGDPERAREALRELRPGSSGAPEWIAILALEEWVRLEAREDPGGALRWLRPAVEARPEHPTLRLQLANLLDRVGSREAAAEHLDRSMRLRPPEGVGSERAAYNRWPTALLEASARELRQGRDGRLRALLGALEGSG